MPNDNKIFHIEIPGYKPADWDEDTFNARKDKLFKNHSDADVTELAPYTQDMKLNDGDSLRISVDGYKPTTWDAARFNKNKDKLLKNHPDAKIYLKSPYMADTSEAGQKAEGKFPASATAIMRGRQEVSTEADIPEETKLWMSARQAAAVKDETASVPESAEAPVEEPQGSSVTEEEKLDPAEWNYYRQLGAALKGGVDQNMQGVQQAADAASTPAFRSSKVTRGHDTFNQDTGKFEPTYITTNGEVFNDKGYALAQQMMDDFHEQSVKRSVNDLYAKYASSLADDVLKAGNDAAAKALRENSAAISASAGSVPGMALWSSMRLANEQNSPEKMSDDMADSLNKIINDPNFINDAKSEADRLKLDKDKYVSYMQQVVLQQAKEDLYQKMLDAAMPKTHAEYVINGINNSIAGMLARLNMQTLGQRQLAAEAEQLTRKGQNSYIDPSFMDEVARSSIALVADMPFFGVAGKVSGAAVKGITEANIARLTSKGLSWGAAERVTASAMRSSFGYRFADFAIKSAVGQGVTLGTFNTVQDAISQLTVNGKIDLGKVAKSAGEGIATGAVLGAFGGLSHAATYELSGMEKLAADVASFAGESAIFTVSGTAMGDDRPWTEAWSESALTLGVMKVTGSGSKYITGFKDAMKSAKYQYNTSAAMREGGVKFSAAEVKELQTSTGGKGLVDCLSRMEARHSRYRQERPAEEGKKLLVDRKGNHFDDEYGWDDLKEELARNYESLMKDRDISFSTKQKTRYILGGKIDRYIPLVQGYTINHSDGTDTWQVVTNDKYGNRIEARDFKSKDKAEDWMRQIDESISRDDQAQADAFIFEAAVSDMVRRGVDKKEIEEAMTDMQRQWPAFEKFYHGEEKKYQDYIEEQEKRVKRGEIPEKEKENNINARLYYLSENIKDYLGTMDVRHPELMQEFLSRVHSFDSGDMRENRGSANEYGKRITSGGQDVGGGPDAGSSGVDPFAQKAAKEAMDHQTEKDDVAAAIRDRIGGQDFVHYSGPEGEDLVSVYKDENGKEYFLIGFDSNTRKFSAISAEDGSHRLIDLDATLADGATEDFLVDDYLESQVKAKHAADEQERMAREQTEINADIQSRLPLEGTINLNTKEMPVMGKVIGQDADGVIVQAENGTERKLTWEQAGKQLGMRTTPLTDAEISNKLALYDIDVINTADAVREKYAKAVGRPFEYSGVTYVVKSGQVSRVWRDEQSGEVMVEVPAVSDDSGEEQPIQMPAKELLDTFPDIDTPVANSQRIAETASFAPEDNTPRDFRNNPLPMTQDENGQQVVDQTTLWNNDPEAYVHWETDNLGDGGETSRLRIQGAIETVMKGNKKANVVGLEQLEKDRVQAIKDCNFVAQKEIEGQIAEKQARLNLLNGILEQMNGQQADNQAEPTVVNEPVEEVPSGKAGKAEEPAKAPDKTEGESVDNWTRRQLDALYDGSLSNKEIHDWVDKKVKKAQADFKKADDALRKKIDKLDIDDIEEERKEAQRLRDEDKDYNDARARLEKFNALKEGIQQIDEAFPESVDSIESGDYQDEAFSDMEPHTALEAAAYFLSSKGVSAGRRIKITPESYEKETGTKASADGSKLVGLFSKKGMSLYAAAEQLAYDYPEFFGETNANDELPQPDTKAARDALIEILRRSRTMSDVNDFIKKNREAAAKTESEYAIGLIVKSLTVDQGMSVEEYENGGRMKIIRKAIGEAVFRDGNEDFVSKLVNEIYEILYAERESGAGLENQAGQNGQTTEGTVLPGSDSVLPGEQLAGRAGQGNISEGAKGNADTVGAEDGTPSGRAEEVGPIPEDLPEDIFPEDLPEFMPEDLPEDLPEASEEATPATPVQQAIAAEESKVDPAPTEAQKEAGNYQKGHIQIDGYDITIETAKGTVRRGTDADGKAWESEMHQNYGYIRRTEGTDGDHIDVFLSDTPEQGNVFVVDQVDPKTGAFDEHKVMYGFNSLDEAKAAYLSNYEEGWQGLGNITEVSREEFKKWVDSSHRKTKPFAEYKSVKPVEQAPQAETMDPQAIVDVYSQIEATKAEDKGKPGRKEILEALYQANPQLVQFRNEQDQLNAVSDVIALARQYPDLAISKAILEKVAPVEAAKAEPAAPAEGEQGVINFDNSEAPAATAETAPEVPVPATKEEARAALDKTITTEKGEMMLPEVLYVNTAIREMDPTGRELRDAPTTQKSAPGIIPHLKNYIDILAAEYGKKLEQFGSPEGVVKYANDRLAELNKKVKSDEILPADYEAAVQDAVDAVGMLIRKMRYDMPSTAHRADYDHLDTSDFNKAVLQLLSKASTDVLAHLAETKNLPWAASGIIRRAIEREQLLKDVQTYRQMYFEQHPEMPSATPKGKFDIWKFVAKDKQRPAMTGVFHDKGFKVASDTHILVAVKEAYPKENEGKIIDKKKNVITEAKYPKWRDLIQKGEDAGIDIDHLASFIEGVKELTGADFTSKKFYDGVKIALPIGGEMRLFPAEPLATFLRAAKEIGGTITYRNLGESGKSMMLQAEGKGGYALIMNTMPSNWSSPMFHWYATPAELEQMAKKREQDHVVAEATSLVTGKPVEEIEAESRPAPVPRTPQEKWDAAAKGLSEAKTAEERAAAMELRRQALQDKLNDIADDEHPVGVVTYDNVMDQLKQDGVDADTIAEVRDGLELDNPNRDTNRAFFLPFDGQGIYIVADDITSLEDGVSAYVHERQHGITLAGALDERLVSTPGFDRKVIWEAMKKWNAGRWYEQKDDITLADEFLSMAMDLAYKCDTPEVFEQELRKAGIDNEEIITFVKNLDNEQRNSEPLSSARQVTLFQDSEQGSRGEDDRDSGEQSGGNLGEEGNRPAQSSEGSPAKRSSNKREVKSGPSRQIEDFGEKIAGARKDELRNLSKTLEDATEQSFVELPLGKAFKRPNTKKLVENGIISEEDAALVDAVSWLIQGSPKPVKLKDRSYKARRRDQEIVDWARQQAGRAKVLLDYINADAEGKKAIIEQLVEVPQDVKAAADAHRNHIIELNKGWKDLKAGELYPINPIYIAYRVFQSTGYNPEVNGRIKFPIIKCDDMGRTYTVKSGNYGYEYAYSVEQALEQATYLVQLQMGVEDLDHPSSAFRVKGIRDKKIGSGRFLVHYWPGSGMRAHYAEQEFDNYQSALEFAKKKFPDRTEEEIKSTAIDEIQKWADPTQFKIVATNSATGDTYELPGDYSSLDEARSAIDSEHETLNAAFNDALREAREKKGEAPASKRDKLYVAWYYENGKGTYGVWAKDKGFWQGTELLKGGFETSKEAREFMEAHRDEYEKQLKEMVQKRSEFVYFDGDNKSRKGKDYRHGKDVGEKEYKAFGFRGVQFGNWANDADRQAALNNAYDSFMHLAELLGVSPAAISLNGELGLAFGARGSGNANAHYESGEVVINLTKTRGAGSLAHEWWHALDNYFARRGGIPHGFATATNIPEMRPELRDAFRTLADVVSKSNYGKRSKNKGDYWGSNWELTARLFAEWLDRRIEDAGESDHFLVRGVGDDIAQRWMDIGYRLYQYRMKAMDRKPEEILSYEDYIKTPEALAGFPYPTTQEIKETFGPLMQNIFDIIQEKSEDGKSVLFSKEVRPITTYHGSAASFDHFDLQFLGSGEGTYVYGPGVYVTEVDGIAKSYADVATGNRLAENRDGIERQQERLQEIRTHYLDVIKRHEDFAAAHEGTEAAESHRKFAGYFRYMLETGDYKYDPEAKQVSDNIKWRQEQNTHEGKRHLYTVEIPGDNGHNYFKYGKQLPREDAMRIKAALRSKLLADPNSGWDMKVVRELDDELNMAFKDIWGEHILGTLDAYLGNDGIGLKSTKFLHDLGYVGMKVDTNNGDPHGDHTHNNYVIFDPNDARITDHVRYSKMTQWPAEDREQSRVRFSKVTDEKVLKELEEGETQIGYRNVVLNADGSLGSPMADKLGKKGEKSVSTVPFSFDEWEQADEHPEMATEDGKINLIKPDKLGNVDAVDYNPYIHIRPTLINKQFTGAWKRPNLVYVATAYPSSELTSGYHAEKAAKAVGRHDWNGGELILSRYDKPVRIVSWDEVADEWVKEFKDRGVTFDIVPPGLLPVLVERGLEILPPKVAAGKSAMAAYERFVNGGRVRFSKAYHGTDADFENFDLSNAGKGEGLHAHGFGHYVTEDKNVARNYAYRMGGTDEQIERAIGSISGQIAADQIRLKNAKTDMARRYYEDAIAASERRIEQMKNSRHIYTVEIPDDNGENYIDEMRTLAKPLRRRVAEAVRNIPEEKLSRTLHGPNWLPEGFKTLANIIEREQYAGLEIRQRLVDALGGGPKAERYASEVLHSAGFVGFKYNGRQDGPCAVIFNDEDIKVSSHVRFSKTNADEHIFISNAENALDNIKMEKATPEQWLKMLEKEGGLKAGEDKWIGLSDWLRASDKKTITKEEVHDFIRKNEIVIEEAHYSENGDDMAIEKAHPGFGRAFYLDEDDFRGEVVFGGINDLDAAIELYNNEHEDKIVVDDSEETRVYDPDHKISDDDYDLLLDFGESLVSEGNASFGMINSTRLDYTTDGLENKREIALTVPNIEPYRHYDKIHFGDAGEGRAIAWARFGDASVRRGLTPEEIDALVAKVPAAENWRKEDGSQFVVKNDLYYPDTEGLDGYFYIAHSTKRNSFVVHGHAGRIYGEFETLPEAVERVKEKYRERLSYNEVRKRVLFIDEIQSKRHQDARERGYRSSIPAYENPIIFPQNLEVTEDERQYHTTFRGVTYDVGKGVVGSVDEAKAYFERLINHDIALRNDELGSKKQKAVPDAPFEKNWHELTMKRMLRYAADEGYDVVAWTTGDQQAERYNIGGIVDSIERREHYNLGERYYRINLNGKGNQDLVTDDDGNVIRSLVADFRGKKLSDIVGKEMAQKMLQMSENDVISGEDLRVGGDGMKGFYDDILPRFVNKYGKKWGASTGDILVELSNGVHLDAHSVEVTPAMKESVQKGQVMFSKTQREKGPFGTILRGYEGRAKEAIQKLIEMQEGEAIGALSHPDIGAIDLVWGEAGTNHSDGYGLAKLVKFHPEVVDNLQDILNDMHIVSRSENRINLESDKYKAAVRLSWDDQRKTWLLTVFEKKNSVLDNTTDTAKTSNGSERNDTATPQDTVSGNKDSENSDTAKPSGKKSLFSKLARPIEDIANDEQQKVVDAAKAAGVNVRMETKDKMPSLAGYRSFVKSAFKDGEIVICPELCNGPEDVAMTVVKEFAEHKGLRPLVGEGVFDDFCMDVYRKAQGPLKTELGRRALAHGGNFSEAVADWLAEASEDLDGHGGWTELWDDIRDGLGDMLEKAGVHLPEISQNDVRWLLWNNDANRSKDIINQARRVVVARSMGQEGWRHQIHNVARPVEDIVNEGRQKVAEETDEARRNLDSRMRTIDAKISERWKALRKAASAQREYDRETVRSIIDLAKDLLKNGALSDPTRQEIEKMLTIARWANGRKDLDSAVDAIMDLMVGNQLRHAKESLDNMLKIRGSKVNASGVAVQDKMDVAGQRAMQVFKDAMDMAPETIDEHIAAAEDRMNSTDDSIKAAASDELLGLKYAKNYAENIHASIDEEKGIRNELKQAAEDRRVGTMTPGAYREFVQASEDSLRQNHIERIEAYNNLTGLLSGMLSESIDRGKAFREAEKERIDRIHHFANSDLSGVKRDEHGNKNDRFANNSFLRFFLKPLATFDQMLRAFGSKSVSGEGYLWNHFMRGWVDANDAEYLGLQEATKALDDKVSAVFGRKMRWSDLYSVERTMPTVDVKFWDGGEMKPHTLTQGNLLYIYMVNKMPDGRMKLRRMGIEQEHVNAIKAQMDPRFIELADWLQDDFLVNIRNKYNKVHEKMFGAPMAAIEDYFPLKILANARVREVDIATPDTDGTTPATITGSIIKRRRNSLALDLLGTDAFSVVIEHLQQMEHWAAFAPFNRDLNTLLSYKTFRNRVQNMSGIYGAGSVAWENFRKCAEIASGVYHPAVSRDSIDTTAVNLAKGVTTAKISFRVYTAIKQLLSMPAFISDAGVVEMVKSMSKPWVSWNWAMEELPAFQKRWKSRQAGDTRLMKTDSDWKWWRSKVVDTAARLGMSPNAFVDALTVSIGAKAMYDTRLKRYIKDGYSRDKAEKRAKQDATILYNETQQSNENAFLSAMQLDRTWSSVALTVFRNSSMGYQRQLVDAVRNYEHKLHSGYKEEAIDFMTKQMVRDGIDEEDARGAAKRNYKRSFFRDALRVALFGFIMEFAWNLGSYLPYLIAGDDKNEKKKMLEDASRHALVGGMVEGLSGGSIISEVANKFASGEGVDNYNPSLMPIASDIQSIIKLASYDEVAAANEVLNLLVQAGVGVNPQTIIDAGVAIYDACYGDLDTTKEATLAIMRILNVPQSQTDKILMDGIDFTAEKGLDLSIAEFAKRYADYKVRRGAPALGWVYSDEAREKRVDSYSKRFIKQAQELIRTRGNELDRAYYEYVDTEYKEVDKTLREIRAGRKAAVQSGDKVEVLEYAQMLADFMKTPEFRRYAQAHGQVNAVKRLSSKLKTANSHTRDAIEDQLLQLKHAIVDELSKDRTDK